MSFDPTIVPIVIIGLVCLIFLLIVIYIIVPKAWSETDIERVQENARSECLAFEAKGTSVEEVKNQLQIRLRLKPLPFERRILKREYKALLARLRERDKFNRDFGYDNQEEIKI